MLKSMIENILKEIHGVIKKKQIHMYWFGKTFTVSKPKKHIAKSFLFGEKNNKNVYFYKHKIEFGINIYTQ